MRRRLFAFASPRRSLQYIFPGWLPLVTAIAGILFAIALSRDLLRRWPTTRPLTPFERHYGLKIDPMTAAQLRRRLPENFEVHGRFADAVNALRGKLPNSRNLQGIFVNWKSVESADVSRNEAVDANLGGMQIQDAVLRVLAIADGGTGKLGVTVDDNMLWISTVDDVANRMTRVYDLRDLLGRGGTPADRLAGEAALTARITAAVDPPSWRPRSSTGAIRILAGQGIVTQTAVNHHDLVMYLERLRWQRDLQLLAWRAAAFGVGGMVIGLFPQALLRLRRRRQIRLRGLCQKCGYDLQGNQSGTCPECGTPSKCTCE